MEEMELDLPLERAHSTPSLVASREKVRRKEEHAAMWVDARGLEQLMGLHCVAMVLPAKGEETRAWVGEFRADSTKRKGRESLREGLSTQEGGGE